MRIVAFRATTDQKVYGYGLTHLEAVAHLANKLHRLPHATEVTMEPIVTDPEPSLLLQIRS